MRSGGPEKAGELGRNKGDPQVSGGDPCVTCDATHWTGSRDGADKSELGHGIQRCMQQRPTGSYRDGQGIGGGTWGHPINR